MATVPHIPDVDLDSLQPLDSVVPLAVLSPRSDMMWPNWPPNLPSPELMRHLCVSKAYTYSFVSKLICLPSGSKYSSRTKYTLVASSIFLPS